MFSKLALALCQLADYSELIIFGNFILNCVEISPGIKSQSNDILDSQIIFIWNASQPSCSLKNLKTDFIFERFK